MRLWRILLESWAMRSARQYWGRVLAASFAVVMLLPSGISVAAARSNGLGAVANGVDHSDAGSSDESGKLDVDQPKSVKVKNPRYVEAVVKESLRALASAQAVAQKRPVELTSEATSKAQFFANPDGRTYTAEFSSSPQRVLRDGKWTEIDSTLTAIGTVLRPKATAVDMAISAGGSGPFVSLKTGEGRTLSLRWPTPLPAPDVHDNVATFRGAAGADADLVVTAMPSGFSYDVVLRSRPEKAPVFAVEIDAAGVKLSKTKAGGLLVSDQDGNLLASGPEPVMLSAETNKRSSGSKTRKVGNIESTLRKKGDSLVLTLTPDPKFLDNAATNYPVTVDPTIVLPATVDTYVDGYGNYSNAPNLLAGTYDWADGKPVTRSVSYLSFDTALLAGANISDAQLSMWNDMSWNCGTAGAALTVSRVTTAWDPQALTWGTQPEVTDSGSSTILDTAACGDGIEVKWPVTAIAQDWAGGQANHGIQLKAVPETGMLYDRAFHSSEKTGTAAKPPTLTVTYTAASPNPVVSELRISPASSDTGTTITSSLAPNLYARVADPAQRPVAAEFQVEHDPSATSQGSGLIWSGTSPEVPSGTEAALQIPQANLTDSWKVRWRARAIAATDASEWSEWQSLTVDLDNPVIADLAISPSELIDGTTTVASLTPEMIAKLTGPSEGTLKAEFEVEHDPTATGQGTGQIWAGAVEGLETGSEAKLKVPADRLQSGWAIRWRARATSAVAVPPSSPWSEWQLVKVAVPVPAVDQPRVLPAQTTGGVSVTPSLTPQLLAGVSDPSGGRLGIEFEVQHDPAAPAQGVGVLWTGALDHILSGMQGSIAVPGGVLKDGWRVQWRVRAVKAGIASAWTDWQGLQVNSASTIDLAAPSNLTAAAGDGSAMVTWTAPVGDVTAYTVTSWPQGHTITVAGTETRAGLGGLANGTPYAFTVVAVGGAGSSLVSAPSASIVPSQPRPPGAPLITDVYPRDSAIRLSWAAPETGSQGLTKYLIAIEPGGRVVEASPDVTEWIITDLVNGTPYSFTIQGVNSQSEGEVSPPSYPVAPELADVPLKPAGLLTTALDGRIDVQWVPPADGGAPITGYVVTVEPGSHREELPADTTVMAVTGLANGTAYQVAVIAKNKAGDSEAANIEQVTPSASRVPDAPRGLRVSPEREGAVRALWAPPEDIGTSAVTEYEVVIQPGDKRVVANDCSGTPIECSAVIDGLDPSVDYNFTVAAKNAVGMGASSVVAGPVSPKVSVQQRPIVLSDAAIAALQAVHSDGTLVFKDPPAEVIGLKANDLLVMNPNGQLQTGFMGRVENMVSQTGLLMVSTQHADLADAFPDAELAGTVPLTAASLREFIPVSPGISISEPIIKGKTRSQLDDEPKPGDLELRVRDGHFIVKVEKEFQDPSFGSSGKITASFDVGMDPEFGTNSETGEVKVGLTLSSESEVRVKGGGSLAASREFDLGEIGMKCITFLVADVPVVICPAARAKFRVDTKASMGMSVVAKHNFKAAVRCHVGGPVEDGCTADVVENEATGLDGAQFYGDTEMKVSVPFDVSFFVYDAIGPAVTADPFVQFEADTTANPWWEVLVGFEAGISINTGPLVPGDGTIYRKGDLIKFSYTAFHAPGEFLGMRVTPDEVVTTIGEKVTLKAEAPSLPDVILNEHWAVEGSFSDHPLASVESNGVVTALGYGVAKVQAISEEFPGVHPKLVATAVVRIGAVPGPPQSVAVAPTTGGAHIRWSPPTNTGASPIRRYAIVATPLMQGPFALDSTPSRKVMFAGSSSTQAFFAELVPGVTYSITVQAINDHGTGTPSDAVSVMPIFVDFLGTNTNDIATDASGRPDNTLTAGSAGFAAAYGGRFVFFMTQARSNLAPKEVFDPASEAYYMVRKDLATGEITLASRGLDGRTPLSQSNALYASRDGNVAAYYGFDTTSNSYVTYIHNIEEHSTWTVPVWVRALSADGSIAVYDNSVEGDGHGVYRSVNGSPSRIDICEGTEFCFKPDVSFDGNIIVYQKWRSSVDDVDGDGVYLYDASSGVTRKLFKDSPDKETGMVRISGDGRRVATTIEREISGARQFMLAIVGVDQSTIDPTTAVWTQDCPVTGQCFVPEAWDLDEYGQNLALQTGEVNSTFQLAMYSTRSGMRLLPPETTGFVGGFEQSPPQLVRGGFVVYTLEKHRNGEKIPGLYSETCSWQACEWW